MLRETWTVSREELVCGPEWRGLMQTQSITDQLIWLFFFLSLEAVHGVNTPWGKISYGIDLNVYCFISADPAEEATFLLVNCSDMELLVIRQIYSQGWKCHCVLACDHFDLEWNISTADIKFYNEFQWLWWPLDFPSSSTSTSNLDLFRKLAPRVPDGLAPTDIYGSQTMNPLTVPNIWAFM